MLHLVFADPQDEYFGEGMLRLGLWEYLWLELRKQYSEVYFIRADRRHGGVLVTRIDGRKVEYCDNIWSTPARQFSDWLRRGMSAPQHSAAAFVCESRDFCDIVSGKPGEGWKACGLPDMLASIPNPTGLLVLTLPLDAEQSKEQLLNNPLILRLRQNEQTNGLIDKLLSDDNPRIGHTVLSAASGETLHNMLLRIQMEEPERCLSQEEQARLEYYLLRYLADYRVQQKECLLERRTPSLYMKCIGLYRVLKDRDTWGQLLERARNADSREPLLEKARNGQNWAQFLESSRHEICREEHMFLASALPPARNSKIGTDILTLFRKDAWEEATGQSVNEELVKKLLAPHDEAVNPSLRDALTDFLAGGNQESPSTMSCRLKAIRFCVDNLYIPESSDAIVIVKVLQNSLDVLLTLENKNFCMSPQQKWDELRQKSDIIHKTLDRAIEKFGTAKFGGEVKESLQKIERIQRDIESIQRDIGGESDPAQPPPPQPETPKPPIGWINLTPEDKGNLFYPWREPQKK